MNIEKLKLILDNAGINYWENPMSWISEHFTKSDFDEQIDLDNSEVSICGELTVKVSRILKEMFPEYYNRCYKQNSYEHFEMYSTVIECNHNELLIVDANNESEIFKLLGK